ncbi:uncharacterized protein LOC144566854 [Carex rostrata]
MEFLKDGDHEEDLHLRIERHLLLLLSDDNPNSFDAPSNVSKDSLYLFKIVHGSCGCTNWRYSESQVHKIDDYAKVEMVHRVNKVLKPKNGNGTGVFIPEPAGHLSRRNKFKQHRF